MEKSWKNQFSFGLPIILVTVYFSSILSENRNNEVEIEYTRLKNYLDEGAIKATVINNTFFGEFKENQTIETPLGMRDDIIKFRLTMPFIDRTTTEEWDAAGVQYSFKRKA